MKCIVWLGNPGREYHLTRHNVGFQMIENLREHWKFSDWKDSKFQWLTSEGSIEGQKIIFIKPSTYMNLSGMSVASLVNFYKMDPLTDMLVISDDIDMEFGKVRFRTQGSHGGQNGLRSIIESLGSDTFARIKIGIGRHAGYNVSDWVLSKFQSEEVKVLQESVFPKVEASLREWLCV